MNKKFSTLVAALLVTGGSFAMVSQYAGSPLTESPLAMAAAANLRATDVASEATAKVGYVSAPATANWTIVKVEDSYVLKTGNFYLCDSEDHDLCKNVADAAVITLGVNHELLINDEAVETTDGKALYLWTDANAQVSELAANTQVYVAPDADQHDPTFDAAEHSAVTVDEAFAPAALSATVADEDWSEFTVARISGNNFTLKVGEYWVAATTGEDGKYTGLKLTSTESEAHLFGTWANAVIYAGDAQYLQITTDGFGNIDTGNSYLFKDGTKMEGRSDFSLPTGLVAGDKVTIATAADGVGINFAGATQATLKCEQGTPVVWTATEKNGGFKLSDGNGCLALDGTSTTVKLDADESNALIFNLDEYGCVMAAGKYLTTGLQLAEDDADALIAYTDGGAIATSADEVKTLGQQIEQDVTMGDQVVAKVATVAANLVNGETYMIWGAGSQNALGMVLDGDNYKLATSSAFSGQASQLKSTASTIKVINQVLWTVTKDSSTGSPLYSFTNVETGKKLAYKKSGANYVFDPAGSITKFSLEGESLTFTVGANKYYVNIAANANTASETPVALTFATPDEAPIGGGSFDVEAAVKLLNETYGMGDGFGLMFKNAAGKDMVLESNPFSDNAIITAVQGPWEAGLNDQMFLKVSGNYPADADDDAATIANFRNSYFIAVDTVRYSDYVTDAESNKFFKYTVVKGSEMMLGDGTVYSDTDDKTKFERGGKYKGITRRIENAEFEVSQVAGATVDDPIKLYVPEAYVPEKNNGKYYLIGHNAAAKQVDLQINIKEFLKKNYVGAYAGESWENIYVGLNNDVDFTTINGIVNLISRNYETDGQVYATGDYRWNYDAELVLAKYVALDKPEGQFLVTGGDYADNGKINPFTFTNRESGATKTFAGFKKTDKANIFACGKDTVEIKAAATADEFDGYANYDAKVLANTEYVLKVISNAATIQDIYITEDHNKDHSLGLTANDMDAANFKLIKFEAAADMDAYKDYGDTVFVSQKPYSYVYVKNGVKQYREAEDRVVAFTYVLYNADNNEFLAEKTVGSTLQNFYYCNPDLKYNGSNADAAQRFIIKQKNNGAVQLIPVNVDNDDFVRNQVDFVTKAVWSKLYAGLSDNKLHEEGSIYKIADNDLFAIEQYGAPLYRTLDVTGNVRIYKEGMPNVALFAETADKSLVSGENLLGMEHKAEADLNKTMFSFVVDPAHADAYKPTYLLAIDATTTPAGKWCEVHQSSTCEHAVETPGFVKGSYLVSLADSLAAVDAEKAHENPYKYDGYARLGFVKATHIGDELAIERGKATDADTLDLTGMTKASFALKIVDQETKSFVMETKDGYIKWLNGVPVVVPTIGQAEVMNIEATENAATANESIAAEGVQVIAGKGVVTVQGAAGKVITVANILGQTIANQVAASDNVTIAAPAGVVVVAVDGDATKVVVK